MTSNALAIGQCIEQRFGDGANARAPGVYRALVERLGHQPPEPLVVGVIEAKHRRLEGFGRHIPQHRASARRVGRLARIDGQRPIRQDRPHVVETGQKQPPQRRVPVDGILGPQPVEVIVRMLTEDRVERSELLGRSATAACLTSSVPPCRGVRTG